MNKMDVHVNLECLTDLENGNIKVDIIQFQKMILLFNSIEDGWSVKKRNGSYVFTKSHENKKEILADNYLYKFMNTNLDISKVIK